LLGAALGAGVPPVGAALEFCPGRLTACWSIGPAFARVIDPMASAIENAIASLITKIDYNGEPLKSNGSFRFRYFSEGNDRVFKA
jgi:hypothetical protein